MQSGVPGQIKSLVRKFADWDNCPCKGLLETADGILQALGSFGFVKDGWLRGGGEAVKRSTSCIAELILLDSLFLCQAYTEYDFAG